MAPKNKSAEELVDMDLTEGVPEELGGQEDTTENNYVPATRQGMGMMNPADNVVLDMDGVRPPFLSLVHGTSKELIEKFNAGDLVLKKEHCVCKKGERVQAILIAIDQYQKERLDQAAWAEGRRPRTFKNKQEAAAAGLRTEWEGDIGPDVGPAMDIVLLLRRNEGVSDALFGVDLGIEDGGKPTEWGFALLSLDKTGYKAFINDIAITVNNKLKSTGLYSGLWELNTELAAPGKKSVNRPFVIRARFKGILDPYVVENIKSAMSVPVSVNDDDADEFP